MKNIKRLMFGFVAVGMFFTSGFLKSNDDLKYQCEGEGNSLACIVYSYKIARDKKGAISMKYGRANLRENNKKIAKVYVNTFNEVKKYCEVEKKFFFFSDEKANRINGKA